MTAGIVGVPVITGRNVIVEEGVEVVVITKGFAEGVADMYMVGMFEIT